MYLNWIFTFLTLFGTLIWLIIALLPWRPWYIEDTLDQHVLNLEEDLSEITILIPARNEAAMIQNTMMGLKQQHNLASIVIVDDQSTDDTVKIIESFKNLPLQIIKGKPLLAGWTGKLWALEQGLSQVNTKYTLLLDADITLNPGVLANLYRKMQEEQLDFASLMVKLSMRHFWEKLLLPAFIFFFRMVYPFQLSNKPKSSIAAGAGGCILVKTQVLKTIGAFQVLRDALIDDCALAKKIKQAGYKTWIGLTKEALSHRCYAKISTIWQMVARTAFVQLKYSSLLLIVCSLLMFCLFCVPIVTLIFVHNPLLKLIAALGLLMMIIIYLPTLRYYQLNWYLALLFPIAGILFLLMTWHSALLYWFGKPSKWKNRYYPKL